MRGGCHCRSPTSRCAALTESASSDATRCCYRKLLRIQWELCPILSDCQWHGPQAWLCRRWRRETRAVGLPPGFVADQSAIPSWSRGHGVSGFDYRRFYECLAPFYAAAARAIPVWLAYARRALPPMPPDGRVLEVGPGPGLLLEELAGRHQLVAGVDLALGMVRQAQRRLRRAGLLVCLVQGDATHLPYAAGSFDGVLGTFAFGAIPDGLAAMREMARVLRPGGVLALVEACVPSDGNPIGKALARLWTLFGDIMRDEAAIMQQAGLEVVESREFGVFNSIRLIVGRKGGTGEKNGEVG